MIQTVSDSAFPKVPKAQKQVTWNTTTAILSLLSALAAARDEILEAIVSNPQLMQFLCILVTKPITPPEVLNEILSCLMTLSEDNLKASQFILADSSTCFSTLLKLKELGNSTSVYACGLLHNMFSALEWHDASPGQDGLTDAKIIPNLCQILPKLKQDQKTYRLTGLEPEVATLALEILASIATDLQVSMTKANKIVEEWNGFGDEPAVENGDGEDEDEEMKHGSDDDGAADVTGQDGTAEDEEDVEMDVDAMLGDMDLVTGGDSDAEADAELADLPTLGEFINKAVPYVTRLSNLAPASDDAVAVVSEALSVLNNIAWTLSCFDYSEPGNASILRVWTPVAKRVWSKVVARVLATDTADISLAALVTSIAWAISRTLQGSTPLEGNEHQKFMALYKASRGLSPKSEEDQAKQGEAEDPFQALGVKCIGVLGQLAQDPAPTDLNREVGVFLVTILDALPDTPAADAVEALNQLMDIYGDESHPCDKAVFWKDDFLKHLENILPKTKALVKTVDKRGATSELRARLDEAVLNLGRFIQYKKKHPPRP